MIKKTFLFSTALLLVGCASAPQFYAPQQLEHNKHSYYLTSQQDLGTIAHYVYLPKKQNSKNWQSKLDVLWDRNKADWNLQQRVAFRERAFANTGVKYFQFEPQQDTLFAYVIYEPSPTNKDWQVDVAKGKQMGRCGFVQYQYSLKVPKSAKMKNMSSAKVANYLKRYVVDKEMKKLREADWVLECQTQP